MITTEYLADGALLIHANGQVDKALAQKLALLVFRSFHLGVRTFFLKIHHMRDLDQNELARLDLIGQGVRNQGGVWNMLDPHSLVADQFMVRMSLQQLPPEAWN